MNGIDVTKKSVVLNACARNGPPAHSRTRFILVSTSIEKEKRTDSW